MGLNAYWRAISTLYDFLMICFGPPNLPGLALGDQYQKNPGPFDHYPTLLNWFKLN